LRAQNASDEVISAAVKSILPLALAIFSGWLLAACLDARTESSSSTSTSSANTDSRGTSSRSTLSTTQDVIGTSATVQELPWVGEVVIRRSSGKGIVIRDKATGGSRFFLSDEEAGECLSFLDANPNPSRKSMEAACSGQVP
jgi:predicted extracellular nuclease